MTIEKVGLIVLKIFKLVLNLIVVILYRIGFNGGFLGVGGTWNLNDDKTSDPEIVASGVIVGYFIYNFVSLINVCLDSSEENYSFNDILMNVIGAFMWVAVGATGLHYWTNYLQENPYVTPGPEKQTGLAMGSLAVINGIAYLIDAGISAAFFVKSKL